MGKNNKKNIAQQCVPQNVNGITTQNMSFLTTTTSSILMTAIPTDEYNRLKQENDDLKKQFLNLVSNERTMQEMKNNINVLTDEKTKIQELNNDLQKINNDLREENKKLTDEISQLKAENAFLKDRICELELLVKKNAEEFNEQIKDLKKIINERETKDLYDKYIIAIQDINNHDKLENTIPCLKKLRSNRIYSCHYLINNDDVSKNNEKRTLFLNKINLMPKDVKAIFDKKYPNLLNDILPCIAPTQTNPDQDTIDEVDDWWDV